MICLLIRLFRISRLIAFTDIIARFCDTVELSKDRKIRRILDPEQEPVDLNRLGDDFVFVNREEQCLEALRAFAEFDELRNP